MTYNKKENISWGQLPTSFTVYAVSVAFFLGGLSMMVNAHDKDIPTMKTEIKAIERILGACCDNIDTASVFRKDNP